MVAGGIDPRVIKVSAQPVPPSDYRLLPEGGSPQLALEIFWSGVFSMGLNGETPDEVTDKGGIIYRCLHVKPWTYNGFNSAIFISTEGNPVS